MGSERLVVTGLGVVSALGRRLDQFWDALTAGRTAFSEVESLDLTGFRTSRGAEIKDGPERSVHAYAEAAAFAALEDAGLARADRSRLAVCVGTTFGDVQPLEALVTRHLSGELSRERLDELARAHAPWTLALKLAERLGARGPAFTLTTACAAGNSALIAAADQVASGRADFAVAGGADALSRVEYAAFSRLLSVAPDLCEPFSPDRRGIMPGEGAGFLVVETAARAKARGARVYAEVAGFGASCDAAHVTMPDAGGVSRAVAACLKDAGLSAEDVDYVNAHGTGTPANDRAETAALKAVLGSRAASTPVSSIKSMLGHAMGAASALEGAATCLTLERGVLPPTANWRAGDPDCDLDYVGRTARPAKVRVALSNAFAFGGSNAVVAFAAPGARPAPARAAREIAVTAAVSLTEADPKAAAERAIPDADLRAVDRTMALALCGVKAALEQAGLAGPSDDLGLVLDGGEELESFVEFWRGFLAEGPMGIDPRVVPSLLANAPSSRAAITFGLRLLNESLSTGFSGGEAAVSRAVDWLQRRDGALVSGAVGRTANLVVLEPAARAKARGAKILCTVSVASHALVGGAAPSDCDCFAAAARKAAETGRALDFRGRGAGGAELRLRLSPEGAS